MRSYYFISGMPRSGSTLLANLIGQHPQVNAFSKSGLIETVVGVRNDWYSCEEHRAMERTLAREKLHNVLRMIFHGYYASEMAPVIVDDSRGWLAYIEMAAEILRDQDIKILVPVRDIRSILASFELLWRKSTPHTQTAQERKNYIKMQTLAGRCEVWMQPDSPVGLAYNRLRDAFRRGHGRKMYLVPYEELVTETSAVMTGIHSFLELDQYETDTAKIASVVRENEAADLFYGFSGLHSTRESVSESNTRWGEVLGHAARNYEHLNELWSPR